MRKIQSSATPIGVFGTFGMLVALEVVVVLVVLVSGVSFAATAAFEVSPTHGRSDASFTSTYKLEHESGCPAGQPVRFTWGTQQILLGASPLGRVGITCIARLTARPPAFDRAPGLYSICGTYTEPTQATIVACADYTVDPGGPPNSPSPSPSGSPGATPTGGGDGTPGPGGTGTGSPGTTPGGTTSGSPGASPTGGPGSTNPDGGGGAALPLLIGGALILGAASAIYEYRRRRR
jgi:hypothetical protein